MTTQKTQKSECVTDRPTDQPTDQPTDRPTDRRTDTVEYRVAFTRLKMKMTSQKDENLVQVQQQGSVYFCMKMIFES